MAAPIAITPGEPAGIGPEIVVRFLAERPASPAVVIADRSMMRAAARSLGVDLEFVVDEPDGERRVRCVDLPLARDVAAGKLDPGNAAYVVATLDRAIDGCLEGEYSALVTGPVHKGVINDAGIPFSGHTERLADRTGAKNVVMLLAAGPLRVALATTHLPLREVPRALNRAGLVACLDTLHRDLRSRFAIASPRIAVCGLNPHAGEGGHLGREEIELIGPVCEECRAAGFQVDGPLPADTVFLPRFSERYDAILAMYHDQGLPVLKRAGFGEAVNLTLGLPIIRTSVDHGTALDIAGRGLADCGSLRAAFSLAMDLVARGHQDGA